MRQLFISASLLLLPFSVSASEMRYQAVNPAFGGYPGNGDYLMRTADAQKPTKSSLGDPRETFGAQVTRYLLSSIAANISSQILGEDAADSGIFVLQDTTIEFNRVGSIVNVTITNATGSTNLQLPVQTF